jgi:hypothetical protein
MLIYCIFRKEIRFFDMFHQFKIPYASLFNKLSVICTDLSPYTEHENGMQFNRKIMFNHEKVNIDTIFHNMIHRLTH